MITLSAADSEDDMDDDLVTSQRDSVLEVRQVGSDTSLKIKYGKAENSTGSALQICVS